MTAYVFVAIIQILCLIVLVLCTLAFPVLTFVLNELKEARNWKTHGIFFVGIGANLLMLLCSLFVIRAFLL